MQDQRSFKKTATFPIVNRKRTLVFVDLYSDDQLMKLGVALQSALGATFVGFTATDGEGNSTHEISIEWTVTDSEAKIATIDAVIAAWMEGL